MKHPTEGWWFYCIGARYLGVIMKVLCSSLSVDSWMSSLLLITSQLMTPRGQLSALRPASSLRWSATSAAYRDNLEPDLRELWHPLWLLLVHCQQIQQYSPENVHNCYCHPSWREDLQNIHNTPSFCSETSIFCTNWHFKSKVINDVILQAAVQLDNVGEWFVFKMILEKYLYWYLIYRSFLETISYSAKPPALW